MGGVDVGALVLRVVFYTGTIPVFPQIGVDLYRVPDIETAHLLEEIIFCIMVQGLQILDFERKGLSLGTGVGGRVDLKELIKMGGIIERKLRYAVVLKPWVVVTIKIIASDTIRR